MKEAAAVPPKNFGTGQTRMIMYVPTAPRLFPALRNRLHAMTISITPIANQRMRQFLAQTPTAAGVRFGVKRTGCSGFAYVVDLVDGLGTDDRLLEIDGVPVVVDQKSLPLVDGTVIDFQRNGLNASFVFHNPNATGECGCGESFTVG